MNYSLIAEISCLGYVAFPGGVHIRQRVGLLCSEVMT
jgi:hypothetical protein